MGRMFKFELFCQGEQMTMEHWAESAPSVCPHNPAHSLDMGRTRVLEVMNADEIETIIREESNESDTGGYFQAEDFSIDVPAEQAETIKDLVWPIGISVLCARHAAPEASIGDEIEAMVAPGTLVGVTTAVAPAGATAIPVSQTVVDNVKKGFWCDIGTHDAGRVIRVDAVARTIEIETPLAAEMPAFSYVVMTVRIIPRHKIATRDVWDIGGSKIGASYIPAGTTMRLVYTSKNMLAKTFDFALEILY